MRYLFGLMCVCALSAFPLIGCSETSSTGGSGGSAGAGGEAGGGGSAGEGGEGGTGGATAEVRLFVQGWEPAGTTGPLAGVEVCEVDTDNCVTTSETGNAVIELPAEEEVAITYAKEGYAKYLQMLTVPAEGLPVAFALGMDQRLQEQHELVGSPYPMDGTGTMFVEILNGYAGATLALVGDATGTRWYRDENLDWDSNLTASTSGGRGGGFTEVAPGIVQVDIGNANCTIARGWAGDADNRLKILIKEGFKSRPNVNCEAP